MMKELIHSKRVIIGVVAIAVILIASILYPFYAAALPAPKKLLYSPNGDLIAAAPFTPYQVPPFGTDRYGVPILYKILEGAKFTISFAVIVSIFRILISVWIGIFMSLYSKRLKTVLKGFSQSFSTIPPIFLAFMMMTPVYISLTIYDAIPSTQWIIILYQLAVCIGVGVPALTSYVTEEIDEFIKQEYVSSAILMGASRWYLIKTHIRLLLREKVLILFMQHIVQALLLFVHLGLLHIFIGGERTMQISSETTHYISLTSEWGGLIGLDRYELNLAPWIVLSPLCAFAVVIFFLNLITEGIKDVNYTRKNVDRVQQNDVANDSHFTPDKEAFSISNLSSEQKSSM